MRLSGILFSDSFQNANMSETENLVSDGISVPPKASSMLESLRGMGYTAETAIADVVDNSISAGADRILIDLHLGKTPDSHWLAIRDNGEGMSKGELISAMRLGSRNPLELRKGRDLGRFGLGMKTASFSQGRRLTVSSFKSGNQSCFYWDLDLLEKEDEWVLRNGPSPDSKNRIEFPCDWGMGTVVLWEKLDRLIPNGTDAKDVGNLLDKISSHLSLVFGEFLSKHQIQLSVNGRKLKARDPFYTENSHTYIQPENFYRGDRGEIIAKVRGYIVPRWEDLSPEEKKGLTPGLFAAKQGFYVYRGDRLIVEGGWLGLGDGWSFDSAHSLARIRIDIPNSADGLWKLDIRKSSAKPPYSMRKNLTWLANDVRKKARNEYFGLNKPGKRGEKSQPAADPLWRREIYGLTTGFVIDLEHPLIKPFISGHSEQAKLLKQLLKQISDTLPVREILKSADSDGQLPLPDKANAFDSERFEALVDILVKSGFSREEALEQVSQRPEFQRTN